jgi:hypothetical protein
VHRDGEARPSGAADDVLELGAAGDLDSRAVEHAGGLRAERPVHEGLDVAGLEEAVAEPRGKSDLREPVDVIMREGLPDAQGECTFALQLLEDRECTEPAVLVVHRDNAAGVREPDPVARGGDHLVVGRAHVDVAEMPGAFLTEHTGRLALLVALNDSARNLEVAVRAGERRRVQPERVVVARHEGGGDVARDRVQRLLGRLDRRGPVAAPPAQPAEPASCRHGRDRVAHALKRLLEGLHALQPHLPLPQCPRREVDVRVGEAREDAATAEIDAVRACERGLVCADPARDELAGDRERACLRQRVVERADDAVLEDHVRNPISRR